MADKAKIEKLIEAYRRDAQERGKSLLEQHRLWRERGSGRGAVSPLGGLAKPAEQTAAPKLEPKSDGRWW